jgi:hypothetical protein
MSLHQMNNTNSCEIVNTKSNNEFTKKKTGINGQEEYTWSEKTKERILQFSYQLIRTDGEQLYKLATILDKILEDLQDELTNGEVLLCEYVEKLSILYKLIAHTRDVVDGKGECMLAYMQIMVWYSHFPKLAKYALKCFVYIDEKNTHPYGSWKDIKYFCNYIRKETKNNEHPLIKYAIELTNTQLLKDVCAKYSCELSLVAKWIPRESKEKFSWIFNELSQLFFKNYLNTAKTPEQLTKARFKCKTDYRKILSSLNKRLNTVQINQCENTWTEIEPSNITSITLYKQRKALLNVHCLDSSKKRVVTHQRDSCAQKLKGYIRKSLEYDTLSTRVKGEKIYLSNFVETAVSLINNWNQDEVDLLNCQWLNNSYQNANIGPVVAMVDTSLDAFSLSTAIGLGIRVAEKSELGKRMMTFGEKPEWFNLDDCKYFVDMVKKVVGSSSNSQKKSAFNLKTFSNFYYALDTLLDVIIETKLPIEQVQDMKIIIFSNMQVINNKDKEFDSMYEAIKTKYEETGLKSIKKPYKVPHVVFWNLESTDGFPALSIHPGVSMISGYNPKMLNLFCEKTSIGSPTGTSTPYTKLKELLNSKRYKCMEDELKKTLYI